MMKIIFLFLTSFAFGFHPDFKPINDRTPLEFRLLFDTLKAAAITQDEKMELVGLCQKLNGPLSKMEQTQAYWFVKSELIRSLLENKFSKIKSIDLNVGTLKNFEDQLQTKSAQFSPYAAWIFRGIRSDINQMKSHGFITDRNFDLRFFQGEKLKTAQKIDKIWRYIGPWVSFLIHQPTSKINQEVLKVGRMNLLRLVDKSQLFFYHSQTNTTEAQLEAFNIPQDVLNLSSSNAPTQKTEPQDLTEASALERSRAQKTIDKIEPEDMSPMSDVMNKELQKAITP